MGQEHSPEPGCGGRGEPPQTRRGRDLSPVMSAVLRHPFTSLLVKRLSSLLKCLQGDRQNLVSWMVLICPTMITCKVKNLFPCSLAI